MQYSIFLIKRCSGWLVVGGYPSPSLRRRHDWSNLPIKTPSFSVFSKFK